MLTKKWFLAEILTPVSLAIALSSQPDANTAETPILSLVIVLAIALSSQPDANFTRSAEAKLSRESVAIDVVCHKKGDAQIWASLWILPSFCFPLLRDRISNQGLGVKPLIHALTTLLGHSQV